MAYTVPHTWVAGDFLRASWLNLTTTDLVDHEARIVSLEASGSGDVVGPSASIASEIALFDGTTGKLLKRATGTGYVKATSGVYQTPVATVPTTDLSGMIALATQVSGNLPLANLPTNFAQLFRSTVTLTDAQVKALPTTGITLVSAQGAGKRIQLIQASFVTNFTAGAYTNIGATAPFIVLRFAGVNGTSGYIGDDATASPALSNLTDFLAATAKHITLFPQSEAETANGWGVFTRVTDIDANQALTLNCDNDANGNFTGGNAANTLTVNVVYMVVP